jgi:thioredoxin-related protein
MKIKVFWREACPKCPEAKALLADVSNAEFFNLDDADGLAEGAYHGVLATPSIIVCDESGKEIISWRGEVPSRQQLAAWILN